MRASPAGAQPQVWSRRNPIRAGVLPRQRYLETWLTGCQIAQVVQPEIARHHRHSGRRGHGPAAGLREVSRSVCPSCNRTRASAPLNTGTTFESRDGGSRTETTPGVLLDLRFCPESPLWTPAWLTTYTRLSPNAINSRDFSLRSFQRGEKGAGLTT